MEMMDEDGKPTGKGYNDWKMGWFEPRSDCKIDQYHACKADTLREIGKTYSEEIVEGNIGAYCIADHPDYPYYLCEWVGKPWQAEKDEEIEIGEESFVVHKHDWLCRGVWFEKLPSGRNWHTMTKNHQECIVRLETVMHANLILRARSEENPLPPRTWKTSVAIADERGAWRMSDDDHAFLMEESRNREECNEYDKELALQVREEEERAKKWTQAPNLHENESDEEEYDEQDALAT